jgi:serpin B
MIRVRCAAVVLGVVGLLGGGAARSLHAAEPTSGTVVSEGIAKMAWDLVGTAGDGNVVISPASVWGALAMTHAGARGSTAAEIAGVLGMPDDREQLAAAVESLRNTFKIAEGANITLDSANRVWVQKGKPLDAGFVSLLQTRYGAAPGEVDFATAPEAARAEVNRWVSDHTEGKIDELMKSDTIDPLTRLVLTNAVYFKAPWLQPFSKEDTREEPFTLASGEKVGVPFMHRAGQLIAGKVDVGGQAATACEIPYAGNRLAMILVVPEAENGVSQVVAALDSHWRDKWVANGAPAMKSRPVNLALPRWTARRPLSLKPPLMAMGMKQAFEGGLADFSGIDGTKDLVVTAVVHEGFVDVGEEGTEAAAATGVAIGIRSAAPSREEPLVVRADRPFAWAIIERPTGTILFAGAVRDPRP